MKFLSAVLACLLLLAPAAFAKRVALVIGNDSYQAVPVLAKAVNDALSVSETLKRLDFDVDIGENLTRRDINGRFSKFIERIEPGDTAFFFFSGHGVAVNGQNILLPIDIPASDDADLVRDEAHVVDELIERVKLKGAGVSLFVLDACRNNPFAKAGRRGIGAARGLQVVAPPSGTFVLMSAGAGQEALDRLSDKDPNPNSVFTRELVPLLETPGMTHVALAKSIQASVDRTARSIGHEQQPAFYDQINGEVVLLPDGIKPKVEPKPEVEKPAEVPMDVATKSVETQDPALVEWNAIKDVRSIKILKAFVRKYPDSNYAEYASAMIDDLEADAAQTAKQKKRESEESASLEDLQIAPVEVPGGWFVIVGSYPHDDPGAARKQARRVIGRGFDAEIIDTDQYGNLTDGYYSVVIGPFSRSRALQKLGLVKPLIGDAYIKEVY